MKVGAKTAEARSLRTYRAASFNTLLYVHLIERMSLPLWQMSYCGNSSEPGVSGLDSSPPSSMYLVCDLGRGGSLPWTSSTKWARRHSKRCKLTCLQGPGNSINEWSRAAGDDGQVEPRLCVKEPRDFPGSPVVKTLRFQCRWCRFDPWLGN